jgi:O-antigen ligase
MACVLLTMIRFRERELNALLNGMAFMGSYMGLVSVLERFHVAGWILPPWIGDPSLIPYDPWMTGNLGSSQSGGTLMFPAFNGLLLSLIFVLLFLRARRGESPFVAIAMLLCVVGAFFTYERGVWLGLVLSLLWFPGWCGSARQATMRRAAFACLAAVLFVAARGMASERLQNVDTILYRLALWGAGLRLFMAHPLLGIGFFNFGTAATGVEQGFGSLLPSFREVTDEAASHNTLLTMLVEFGIVGLLFYATMFSKIVQRARMNASRLWGHSGMTWVLAFVIVYLVNAQFISAFEGTTNTAFFSVLGVIAGTQEEIV